MGSGVAISAPRHRASPSADRTRLLGSLSVEIASTFSFNGIVSGPEPGGAFGDYPPLIG